MGDEREQSKLWGRNDVYPRPPLEEGMAEMRVKLRVIVPRHSSSGWRSLAVLPGGKEIKLRTRRRWHRPGLCSCCFPSVCLPLSHTDCLSVSLFRWEKFSHGQEKQTKKTWGGGGGEPNLSVEEQKRQRPVTAFRSQREGNSDKRRFQTPCQGRNSLLILSICKQDFLGLGHFLLLFKFLVRHLLSLLTVPLVMEEDNLPARGREKGRERQRKRERWILEYK